MNHKKELLRSLYGYTMEFNLSSMHCGDGRSTGRSPSFDSVPEQFRLRHTRELQTKSGGSSHLPI